MTRRSILLACSFALLSLTTSSGCWCYRPLAYRLAGPHRVFPLLEPAPLLGPAAFPVGTGAVLGGYPLDPGCVGCDAAPAGLPLVHGSQAHAPVFQSMPAGFAAAPHAGNPALPIAQTPVPTTGMPFTGYPVVMAQNPSQPSLGAPISSKELPPPSMMPTSTGVK